MARLIGIVAIVGIALFMCVFAAEELYSSKYDDIDIQNILTNDRLRNQHRKCYMDLGPCTTSDMRFYKDFIGEAIVTKCKKCTEKQKKNLEILTEWYITNQPKQWEEFVAKVISDLRKKNA
ncbi:ejaculatory bulb-specific protein 3-like [Odontomachus brunneus]|uniref:ejaculatory bulb-specific protein 3-like n=1 Tax=Odontomachus brunneus TaxID=486640 RepID=UPI0013F18D58|nr:ejaculatory bulb-specific protein 3-like [Odontomachus brunneus]